MIKLKNLFLRGEDLSSSLKNPSVIDLCEGLINSTKARKTRNFVHLILDGTPKTDGQNIFIDPDQLKTPVFDSLSAEEQLKIFLGALIHERLHLEYSDFSLLEKMLKHEIFPKGSYPLSEKYLFVLKEINNIIEDYYIDTTCSRVYAGILSDCLKSLNLHLKSMFIDSINGQVVRLFAAVLFFDYEDPTGKLSQLANKIHCAYNNKELERPLDRIKLSYEISEELLSYCSLENNSKNSESKADSKICDEKSTDSSEENMLDPSKLYEKSDHGFEAVRDKLSKADLKQSEHKSKEFEDSALNSQFTRKIVESVQDIISEKIDTVQKENLEVENIDEWLNRDIYKYYNEQKKEMSPWIKSLSQGIQNLLDENTSYYIEGVRSGYLSTKKIAQYKVSNKIFREKVNEKEVENLEVLILIDSSSSMLAFKDLPFKSTLVLTESLERLNIRHQIISFTTKTHFVSNRSFPIAYPLRSNKYDKAKICAINPSANYKPAFKFEMSYEAPVFEHFAKKFFSANATKKIIFVITDGEPYYSLKSDQEITKEFLKIQKDLSQKDIHLFSFLLSEKPLKHDNPLYQSVQKRYKNKVVAINEIKKLSKEVMKKLSYYVFE